MIFKSLLVANRGEIALRIIKTASEMGIKCIAVYVNEDADSPHVKAADESFRLPDGGYLNCLLYTSPSPRDGLLSRMPSSA